MSKQAGFLNGYGIAPVPGSNVNHSLVVPTDPKLPAEQGERCDYDNAERVGQRLNQDAWDQVRQLIKNIP